MSIWERLGIAPTRDRARIREAFARKTRDCHPEDNPEGFLVLRQAYEAAMAQTKPAGACNGRQTAPAHGDASCVAGGAEHVAAAATHGRYRFRRDAPAGDAEETPPARAAECRFPAERAATAAEHVAAAAEYAAVTHGRYLFQRGAVFDETGQDPAACAMGALLFPAQIAAAAACCEGEAPLLHFPPPAQEGGADATSTAAAQAEAATDVLDDLCRLAASPDISPEGVALRLRQEDFLAVCRKPVFLAGLLRSRRNWDQPAVTEALYMAYGCAFSPSGRSLPEMEELYESLRRALPLPLSSVEPEGLPEALARIDALMEGFRLLQDGSQHVWLWRQAFLLPAFRAAQWQPLYMRRLAAALEERAPSQQALTALGEAYAALDGTDVPCALPLAARLGGHFAPCAPSEEDGDARDLWTRGPAPCIAAKRHEAMSLLRRTARHFRHSSSPGPWEHVFQKPWFDVVRMDGEFLENLRDFLSGEVLPSAFWPALAAAYPPGDVTGDGVPDILRPLAKGRVS